MASAASGSAPQRPMRTKTAVRVLAGRAKGPRLSARELQYADPKLPKEAADLLGLPDSDGNPGGDGGHPGAQVVRACLLVDPERNEDDCKFSIGVGFGSRDDHQEWKLLDWGIARENSAMGRRRGRRKERAATANLEKDASSVSLSGTRSNTLSSTTITHIDAFRGRGGTGWAQIRDRVPTSSSDNTRCTRIHVWAVIAPLDILEGVQDISTQTPPEVWVDWNATAKGRLLPFWRSRETGSVRLSWDAAKRSPGANMKWATGGWRVQSME